MLPIKEKNTQQKTNRPLLNVNREDVLYREDIKATFGYSIVGITVSVGLAGLGYIFIKQLQK